MSHPFVFQLFLVVTMLLFCLYPSHGKPPPLAFKDNVKFSKNKNGGSDILLVGDSFDRFWSTEWCEGSKFTYHNYTEPTTLLVYPYMIVWGNPLFRNFRITPCFCRNTQTNDTVASIQIYGSNMTGPYQGGWFTGRVADTEYRVTELMAEYFSMMDGLPDRVMIHTTQWDVALLYETFGAGFGPQHDQYQAILTNQIRRTNAIVDLVENILSAEFARREQLGQKVEYPEIGLRSTSEFKLAQAHLLHVFNEINLNVSIQRNLSFYDFSRDFVSMADGGDVKLESFLRDGLHPIPKLSTPTIDRMLLRRYTPHFTQQGGRVKPLEVLTSAKQLASFDGVEFKLIRANHSETEHLHGNLSRFSSIIRGHGPLYYCSIVNGTRFKWYLGQASHFHHHHQLFNITATLAYEQSMMQALGHIMLSVHSDLIYATESILKSIPTVGIKPILFTANQEVTPFVTRNGDFYLVSKERETFRVVDNAVIAACRSIFNHSLIQNIDSEWLDEMSPHPPHEAVPNIFHDHALVRYVSSKSVFVVLNLTMHSFSGLASFVSRGYDFSDVVVIGKDMELYAHILPVGDAI